MGPRKPFGLLRKSRLTTLSATTSLVLTCMTLAAGPQANAIPAFSRKYGLHSSARDESSPMPNYFGQKFNYSGCRLMNGRKSPIWQNPGYLPVPFRMTPIRYGVRAAKAADEASGITPITTF